MNNLTDEQLSALSILLEIEVVELFNMSLTEIKKKTKKVAKTRKVTVRESLKVTGAYRMLYDEADLDALVKILR